MLLLNIGISRTYRSESTQAKMLGTSYYLIFHYFKEHFRKKIKKLKLLKILNLKMVEMVSLKNMPTLLAGTNNNQNLEFQNLARLVNNSNKPFQWKILNRACDFNFSLSFQKLPNCGIKKFVTKLRKFLGAATQPLTLNTACLLLWLHLFFSARFVSKVYVCYLSSPSKIARRSINHKMKHLTNFQICCAIYELCSSASSSVCILACKLN